MKKHLFFIALIAIFSSCESLFPTITSSITGTIKNSTTFEPVAQCLVTMQPGDYSAYTDANGMFKFSKLAKGSYKLEFTKQGYYDSYLNIELEAGKNEQYTITIDALPAGSEEGSNNNFENEDNTDSNFAGGTGSSMEPYQIKTPKQLVNMKNYPDAYFELMNDIDMNGYDWIPFALNKGFNGNNYTISNITVSPYVTKDNVGMFTELGVNGFVKNLTLENISIKHPKLNCVGAIAGYSDGGATITNCHIKLTKELLIQGNDIVGGIIGSATGGMTITNCSVTGIASAVTISGKSNVGGLAGYYYGSKGGEFSNNHVSANIAAVSAGGGIVGWVRSGSGGSTTCSKLSYKGTLTAHAGTNKEYGFGGIFGDATYVNLLESKADVIINIESEKKYVGGLIGFGSSDKIIACYSRGEFKGSITTNSYDDKHMNCFVGYRYNTIQDCYSLMNYPLQGTGSTYTNNYGIYDLVSEYHSPINIAELMRASNAENASYWNYNQTWTWNGNANGKTVSAICPTLDWENK